MSDVKTKITSFLSQNADKIEAAQKIAAPHLSKAKVVGQTVGKVLASEIQNIVDDESTDTKYDYEYSHKLLQEIVSELTNGSIDNQSAIARKATRYMIEGKET